MTASEIMRFAAPLIDGEVTLELLTTSHIDALVTFATHPSLWQWTSVRCLTESALRAYLTSAITAHAAGECLPLATLHRGQVVGSTRYAALAPAHKRCEIGWTFVHPDLWGTSVNARAKYLMLRHAFEVAGLNRVEFKTDALNTRSRRALAALGAVEEGILRRHMICDDGRVRDSVYFSIITEDWPTIRQHLLARIASKAGTAKEPRT
jgi:RimJ/RimL family protein N-acetyltransferase